MARQFEKPGQALKPASGFLHLNTPPKKLTYSQKIQYRTAAAWLPHLAGRDLAREVQG